MSGVGGTLERQVAWRVLRRQEEFDAERDANVLRGIAVLAFYCVHLIRHYVVEQNPDAAFHRYATWIVLAWVFLMAVVWSCLYWRIVPVSLKYFSTGADVALLTAVASLGAKTESPLVFGYFLVIGAAALRFSHGLVWFATAGSAVGFMALVGLTDQRWFDAQHDVPIHVQLIGLVSLGLTGTIAARVVRRSRRLAEAYCEQAAAGERDR